MAARLRSASAAVVAQQETLIRIAARPRQTVPPHQQVPSAWIPAITRRVVASPGKPRRSLRRNGAPGQGRQPAA